MTFDSLLRWHRSEYLRNSGKISYYENFNMPAAESRFWGTRWYLFSAPVYTLRCGAFGNLSTKEFNGTMELHPQARFSKGLVICYVAGVTFLVPCHVVKSLQLIWRSGTRRWNLRVPGFQMIELQWLDRKIGFQESSSSSGRQGDLPYYIPHRILKWTSLFIWYTTVQWMNSQHLKRLYYLLYEIDLNNACICISLARNSQLPFLVFFII